MKLSTILYGCHAQLLALALVAGAFITLLPGCCCKRDSIINGTFTAAEIAKIHSDNKASWDSCNGNTYMLTVYPKKDTAYIYFSGAAMKTSAQGTSIPEVSYTYTTSGVAYTAYVSLDTAVNAVQNTSTGYKPFDSRYAFPIINYKPGGAGGAEIVLTQPAGGLTIDVH